MVNGVLKKPRGVITRTRSTTENSEESAIDFVLISSDILESLESMNIDEERTNVLTSITHTKKGRVKHESDHNSMITKLNIKWQTKNELERTEVFNDKEGQIKFKELTENNNTLSKIFETKDSIENQSKKFIKKLNQIIHQSFKKIGVKPQKRYTN